ncbi:MAG TPA: NADH-quinone oxidoreductase subunit A [Armatimonadota bacterium]|nr:NADH-quinone oxidoreductase subunit A [Armatimonadota bacterium]
MGPGIDSRDYVQAFIFLIGALVFLLVPLGLALLFRPNQPGGLKHTTYECGEEPIGSAWFRHPIQYYLIALVFIVFDVEAIFILPWAVQARALIREGLGLFAFTEMTIFAGILLLGWYYALRKGALEWLK